MIFKVHLRTLLVLMANSIKDSFEIQGGLATLDPSPYLAFLQKIYSSTVEILMLLKYCYMFRYWEPSS